MKISTTIFGEAGYIEYQDCNNKNIKYYISSYYKNVVGIKICIDVFRSLRGGLLFKVKYYYKDFEVYHLNTKEVCISKIEELVTTINRDINSSICV